MGRRREFDEDEVIDRAMRLFWERGYEGAALSDLLDDMEITKSSLYKAFGSKEGLFDRAAQRYEEKHLAFRLDALGEPTPKRIVQRLLMGMVRLHAGAATPPGCLITNAALACSPAADAVRRKTAQDREEFKRLLQERLQAATAAGPLPPGMDSRSAASLVQTIIQGLGVQAKAGASRKELESVVWAFLASWPD